ncbi:hypothetical protein C8Q80DRAFT_1272110 [Daedaleopsis nitida]|nr:hypothetical protein C8Q80DRAFT_1272110 [Daedaleopsis nitida]
MQIRSRGTAFNDRVFLATTRKRATPSTPYHRVSTRRASTSTDSSRSSSQNSNTPTKRAIQQHLSLLPLYHPLGPLAQSLPKIGPGLSGEPSSLNVDDPDDAVGGDSAQSNRARRAAPRTDDDDTPSTGTPNGALQDASGKERNASPRKRRGGGAKRKRKDTDDGDGVFPPPPKRTRNPRGTAANSVPAAPSPLVGPAVVASDLVEAVAEMNGEAEEEAQEEVQAPKRSTRTRKPRTRPVKRRDSSGSASTGTSVSVSIAAATKAVADPKTVEPAETDVAAQLHEDAVNGLNGLARHEEEESGDTPAAPTPVREVVPQEELRPETSIDTPAPAAAQEETDAPDVPTKARAPIPALPSSAPRPSVAPTPPPPMARAVSVTQKEEREEGELSDDGPGTS